MSIRQFLRKYVSEDDKSFGDIMEKEKLGFIAKHYNMFKFLKSDSSKNDKPKIGYKMTEMAIKEEERNALLMGKKNDNKVFLRKSLIKEKCYCKV